MDIGNSCLAHEDWPVVDLLSQIASVDLIAAMVRWVFAFLASSHLECEQLQIAAEVQRDSDHP